ncbi:ATP-binding protein [Streptomyces sp. NPDC015220]|uniref:ATP-binding protein n=1 Tax=Streptomyces sp. NPDC015220 TaxID=3364947 RepID=UPI0036FC1F6B
MVIPLRKQAADGRHPAAVLSYGAVWGAEGTSLADARSAARTLLARAGYPPRHQISQDAQIVISELIANALRHAPGPGGILLEVLTSDPARLRITVRDSSPHAPRLRVPDPHRIGGHGLHLITRLCDRFRTTRREDGKHVTAEMWLPRPTPAEDRPDVRRGRPGTGQGASRN